MSVCIYYTQDEDRFGVNTHARTSALRVWISDATYATSNEDLMSRGSSLLNAVNKNGMPPYVKFRGRAVDITLRAGG